MLNIDEVMKSPSLKVMKLPSLDVFKKQLDLTLRAMV